MTTSTLTPTPITVPAKQRWYHTEYMLERDASYYFSVPAGQTWKDWFVKNGPAGGTTAIQRPLRGHLRFPPDRDPRAEFFSLIGTIDESLAHAFLIGAGPCAFTAPISGELVCFANDIWPAYWNNRGEMQLTIVRTS